MSSKNRKWIIAITLLWIGFLCAISFMEAWLKFRAEGVTLPIGLSIGKLIFGVLNKVELFLALLIFGILFRSKSLTHQSFLWFYAAFALLLFQTFYLLPELDARAAMIIAGETVQKSYTHFVYVAFDFLKTIGLVVVIVKLFKRLGGNNRYGSNF